MALKGLTLLALALVHVKRVEDRLRHLGRVKRVNHDGARAERLRGAGELRQYQHAVVAPLAQNVLERNLRHALAQRRDQRDVGDEGEGAQVDG